jgi:Zn-dependent protease
MAFTLALMGVVFASVLLHETGHVLAGRRAGGWAPQILLWPLGGLAEVQGVPRAPRPQILLAASGPLVNLALAALLLPVLIALDLPLLGEPGMPFARRLLVSAFHVNLVQFALNLVPAFPLDGGNVLRWGLAGLAGGELAPATLAAARTGKVFAVLLGIAGVAFWAHPYASLLFFLALFAWLACEREKRMAEASLVERDEEPSFLDPEAEPALEAAAEPAPPGFFARWRERREVRRREAEIRREVEVRRRVDALLEKIAGAGMTALTEKEKAFLREASKRYQKDGTARP